MSTTTERLAILIDANASGALREFDKVGAKAEREMGRAENSTDKLGASMTRNGALMVGAGALMVAGLANASKASMDLNDEVSQSDAIFGEAAASINEFAKGAVAIGQSERAASAAANTFGLFFTNAGKSADEAAGMSIEMSKLASDMASFKNTTPEEAVEALGAALRGESEPIRRYGVMLDEATLKQRALDMGLIDSATGTLPPAIKMQAAYAEILAQTTTIQGDFARTADSGTNAQRRMAAEAENAKAAIGQGFVPIMTKAYEVAGLFGSAVATADGATGGLSSSVLAYGSVGLVAVGATTTLVGKMIEMRATLQAAQASTSAFMAAHSTLMSGLAAGGIVVAGGLVAWQIWEKAIERTRGQVDALAESQRAANQTEGYDALVDRFQAVNDQISDLDSTIANSTAPWDADFRAQLNEGRNALQETNNELGVQIGLADALSAATGKSSSETMAWVQSQAAAGITFDSSSVALAAYTGNIDTNTLSAEEAKTAQDAYAKSVSDAAEAIRNATNPYFAAIDAQESFNEAQQRYTLLALDGKGATEEGSAAYQAMTQSGLGLVSALLDLNAKQADGTATAADLQAAMGLLTSLGIDPTSEAARALQGEFYLASVTGGALGAQVIRPTVDANTEPFYRKLNEASSAFDRFAMKTTIGPGQGLGFMLPGAAPGRASGGPMAPWSVYELHDTASPEVAQIGGRTMLFTGAQGGQVTNLDRAPARQTAGAASGRPAEVVIQLDGKTIARAMRPHLRVLDNEAR